MTGLVTFRLGAGEYATPLQDVREVVRLGGLADLPGMMEILRGPNEETKVHVCM